MKKVEDSKQHIQLHPEPSTSGSRRNTCDTSEKEGDITSVKCASDEDKSFESSDSEAGKHKPKKQKVYAQKYNTIWERNDI